MLTFIIALGVITFHIFRLLLLQQKTNLKYFEQMGFFGYGSNEHSGPLERGYCNRGYVLTNACWGYGHLRIYLDILRKYSNNMNIRHKSIVKHRCCVKGE